MKTIYARLGDIKLGETLEDGTSIGSIGSALGVVGVDLLNQEGELRNMGDVIEDLMGKWEGLTRAEQQAVAVQLAGKYQYNNLLALLDNADMYYDQLGESLTSLGTINEQQAIYMESLEGKLSAVQANFEGFLGSIFNADDVKPAIDAVGELFNILTQFSDALGGGGTFLRGLIPIAGRMFSTQISRGLTNSLTNLTREENREAQNKAAVAELKSMGLDNVTDEYNKRIVDFAITGQRVSDQLNEEQRTEFNAIKTQLVDASNMYIQASNELEAIVNRINSAAYLATGENIIGKKKDGTLDITDFIETNALDPEAMTFNKEELEAIAKKDYEILSSYLSKDNGFVALEASLEEAYALIDKISLRSIDTTTLPKDTEDLRNSLQNTYFSLSELSSSNLSDKFSTQINTVLKDMDKLSAKTAANTKRDVTRIIDDLGQLRNDIEKTVASYRTLSETDKVPNVDEFLKALQNEQLAGVAKDAATNKADTFEQGLITQEQINSIINLSSAVGQLAFAWSSFQSLGSLWSDEDLSIGDKLLQTIMNLAFTIPALLDTFSILRNAYVEMRRASAAATTEDTVATTANTVATDANTASTTKNAAAKDVSAAASHRDAKAQKADTAATVASNASSILDGGGSGGLGSLFGKGAAKAGKKAGENLAKKGLSAILKTALKSFLPLTVALTVTDIVGMAKDGVEQARQQAIEDQRNVSDAFKETITNTDADYSTMTMLYEEYEETGEASSEFESTLRTLGESFGIQNTEALLAAGAYDELTGKIKAAREEALQDWYSSENETLKQMDQDYNKAMQNYVNEAGNDGFQWADILTGIKDAITDFWLDFKNTGFGKFITDVGTWATDIITKIDNFITDFINFPGKIVAGFLGGIADLMYGIGNAFPALFGGLIDSSHEVAKSAAKLLGYEDTDFYRDQKVDYVGQFAQEMGVANAETGKEEYVNQAQADFYNSDEYQTLANETYDAAEGVKEFRQSIIDAAGLADVLTPDDFINSDTINSKLTGEQKFAFSKAFEEATGTPYLEEDTPTLQAYDVLIAQATEDAQNNKPVVKDDDLWREILNWIDTMGEDRNEVLGKLSAEEFGIKEDAKGNLYMDQPVDTQTMTDFVNAVLDTSSVYGKEGLTDDIRQSIWQALREKAAGDPWENVERLQEERAANAYKVVDDWYNALEEGQNEYVEAATQSFEEAKNAELESMTEDVRAEAGEAYDEGYNEALALQEQQAQENNLTYGEWLAQLSENAGKSEEEGGSATPSQESPTYLEGSLADQLNVLFGEQAMGDIRDSGDTIHEVADLAEMLGVDGAEAIGKLSDAVNSGNFDEIALSADNAQEALSGFLEDLKEVANGDEYAPEMKAIASTLAEEVQSQIDNLTSLGTEIQDRQDRIQEYANSIIGGFFDSATFSDEHGIFKQGTTQDYYTQIADWGVQQGLYDATDAVYNFIVSLGNTDTALSDLATSASSAGSSVDAEMFTRQNYEQDVFYGNKGALTSVVGMEDEDANKVYGALETYAAEGGIDASQIDLNTVDAIIQQVLNSGGDLELAIDTFTSGLFNLARDYSTYQDEMANVFNSGEFDEWSTENFNSRYADAVQEMVDANENDNGITGEMLQNIGMDDEVVRVLEAASDQSEALADSLSLVTNNSFESQRSISELGQTFDSLDYYKQINDIEDTQQAIADTEAELESLQNASGDPIEIEADVSDAEDKLDELKDQLTDQQFALEINVAGDLIDKADETIEAIDDVKSAIDLIGDDYTVDYSDLDQLVSVFPDILDSATVTAEGLIQLDQAVVDSSINAAQSEIMNAIGKDQGKLESAINYAGAMADMYQAQADAFGDLAGQEEVTKEELDTQKAASEQAVTEAQQAMLADLDQSTFDAMTNAAQYSVDSGNAQITSSEQATNIQAQNFSIMASNSAIAARIMIDNARSAYDAWASVSNAMSGNDSGFKDGGTNAGGGFGSGVGGGISANMPSKGDVSQGTENTYDGGKSPKDEAAEEQAKYQALADAWNNIQAQLQASLLGMQGAAGGITTPGNRGGSGSGGGGGGGGGGDGSGSAYDPKQEEYQENELDRYEKVDTALDAIANDLDKIATEQERLTGHELVKNMEDQIDLLMTQIELEKEKLEIQKEEAQEYADQLKQYGIQFDEEGFITNYKEIYEQELNKLNAVIDQYNKTTTEEGQEALEAVMDEQQESYEKFNDLVDKYDELISNSMKETIANIEDAENSIEDLRITAFETSIEAVDNIKDIQEALIEFNAVFSGRDSEDPFRAMATSAQMLSKYFDVATTSAEEYYDTLIDKQKEIANAADATEQDKRVANAAIKIYEEALRRAQAGDYQGATGTGYLDMEAANLAVIMEQIKQFEETGKSDIFGLNSADMYDVAQSIFESATEMISDYESQVDELRDAILDAIDDVAERMEERREAFENITDELDHQQSLIEMIYGEKSYNLLDQLYGAINTNYTAQINEVKEQIKVWEDLLDNLTEGSDEWKAVHEQIADAQADLNDLVESAVENLQTKYQNAINATLDSWVGSAFGGNAEGFGDLDWVAEQWEMINRNADQYLDEVQKAYNIEKLQAAYTELLDGSNDLHIQQQISQQMEEQLGYLREKDKLSQYDVAYANAQLEILQKRIALEEAQRNKSQLQLRRDTQGNYSYVYTADEGNVAAAQGDLLDAQNNAYELSKQNITDVQSNALQEIQNAYSLINDTLNNASLTVEERSERVKQIIDSLHEYLEGCAEQLSTSEANIINDYMALFDLLSEENKAGMEDVYNQIVQGNLDAFDEIDTRWATSLTNWLQNLDAFKESSNEMFEAAKDHMTSFEEDANAIGDLVGQDFGNMSDVIQGTIDKTNDLASSTSDFINQLRDDTGVIKEYEDTLSEYAAKIADVTNEMKTYQNLVNELGNKLTQKEQENANLSGQIQDLEDQLQQAHGSANGGNGSGSGGAGGSGSGNGTNYTDEQLKLGIAQSIWTYGSSAGWGNDPIRSTQLTQGFGADFAKAVQDTINTYVWSGRGNDLINYDSMKFSSFNLLKYDTGGYTGDFGGDKHAGKLAILHEKELVLNATDTENILAVVDMVRNMTQTLKAGLGSSMTTMLNQMASQFADLPLQEMKQDVNIEATFPNVHDAAEIEQAILNLNNEVAQYMYKTVY